MITITPEMLAAGDAAYDKATEALCELDEIDGPAVCTAIYTAMAPLAPPPDPADARLDFYRTAISNWFNALQAGQSGQAAKLHQLVMAFESAYPLDALKHVSGMGVPPGEHLRNSLDRYMADHAAPSAQAAPVVESELSESGSDAPPTEGGQP